MTAPSEQDPIARIVDIDTFQYWIVGYVSDVLVKLPKKERSSEEEMAAFLGIDYEKRIQENIKRARAGRPASPIFPLLPREIFITGVPWDEVPESLKELLMFQYDAAKLDEEKNIDVVLTTQEIRLRLRSLHVDGTVDLYGGYYTGIHGVRLEFGGDTRWDTITNRKGKFLIYKTPTTLVNEILLNEIQGEGQPRQMNIGLYEVPATLSHMQDMARLLERFKQSAE